MQQEKIAPLQSRLQAAMMQAAAKSGDNPAVINALQRFGEMIQSLMVEA